MTLVFGACLAVGAVTVLFSLFAGGDHDADGHADGDAGVDGHADGQADGHVDAHGPTGAADFWVLFLSMRFWIFFLTFFGLTGLLLQLAGAGAVLASALALPMGTGLGVGGAYTFRRLREQTVTSQMVPDELVGAEAKVMLPVSAETPGKVRIETRGMVIDRVALVEGPETLARGEKALVIGVRGERLLVARAPGR